jgi:hypothetical protein
MRIIAAVFIDTIQLREAPGPSTRIDLGGVKFSEVAPSPVPVTVEPHLVVLVYCPNDHKAEAVLEVTYFRDGEQIARNVQMLSVEPGKFNYRLVRAELTFEEYGVVEAHARVDLGDPIVVPYTLLPPVEA